MPTQQPPHNFNKNATACGFPASTASQPYLLRHNELVGLGRFTILIFWAKST
jgi:hypothetical protein